jgi:hypothetical protein
MQDKSERHTLQAEGKHPAPCARFCESTAFQIKIRGLEAEVQALRGAVPADFETTVREYIDEYEMLGETGDGFEACYTPNDNDKALLLDAFMGFDFSPWLAAAPQPAQVEKQ